MKKLILILLFAPLFSFGQKISNELINEATKQWTFHFEGNPIDGQARTAFRINNEFDDEIVFLLKVKNKAETVKIKNATGNSENNRDDVFIDIRSSIPTNKIDEVLMYFNDEKKYYKVNFKAYGEKGLIWWNAISDDNLEFISKFNFIHKLKIKNEVFFRFKYNDREDINISFSLNGSSKSINKVVDLSNFKIDEKDDSIMDKVIGMFHNVMVESEIKSKGDLLKLNITGEEFSKKLDKYLSETFGDYVMTFVRFEYKGNLILDVLNLNDKLLKRIDLNQFKEDPKTPIQALYSDLIHQKYYTNSFEEFTVKMSNKDYQDKVYSVLVRDGKYNKPKTEFYSEYSSSRDKKIEFLFNYLKENGIFSDKTLLPKFKEANAEQKKGVYDLAMKEGIFKSLKFQEFLSNWDAEIDEEQNIKKNEIYLTNKFWVATVDNFILSKESYAFGEKIIEVKEGDMVQLYSSSIQNTYYQYISYYNMNKDKVYKGYVHKAYYEPSTPD